MCIVLYIHVPALQVYGGSLEGVGWLLLHFCVEGYLELMAEEKDLGLSLREF